MLALKRSDGCCGLRISAGTARVLGLSSVRVDVLPTTAYLMIGEGCVFSCGFCPQARDADSRAGFLSRISWPAFNREEVIRRLSEAADAGLVGRACIQVVHEPGAVRRAEAVVERLASRSAGSLPVSVSVHLENPADCGRLFAIGMDRVGIPVDAASPEVYRRVKGGSWDRAVSAVLGAAEAYPGKVSTHLIVGLGESEKEAVSFIQLMLDRGVTVGLFAFTPVRGTRMASMPVPRVDSYRRVQIAHHLIKRGLSRMELMKFEDGRIVDLGLSWDAVTEALSDGEAFRTSGCPSCNRPYYNERPGGEMYNYPRPLGPEEAVAALEQSGLAPR